MKGVIIYEEHEERVVNNLIKKLLNSEGPDKESIEKLEKKLSTSKFSENINSFIKKTIQNNYHNKLGELYKTKKVKIAVILHLFYFDLACEFRRQLQSLQDHEIDIYISLPKEKYNKEIEKKIKTYFGSICDKIFIFEVENSGMDIKPFIRSIKFINENKKTYDYILKIHSKSPCRCLVKKKERNGERNVKFFIRQ